VGGLAVSHTHWEGGPVCRFRTKRECEDAYADWQADQQVLLAARVVDMGRAGFHKKSSDVFGQLVLVLAGQKETITNSEGVESSAPFTRRVLAALRRYRSQTTGGTGTIGGTDASP
jgi:hypothetical protein